MHKLISGLALVLWAAAMLAQNAATKPERSPAQDYSGMYTFLKDGEFVQITIEGQGKVTGFVSRYGELESDRGAFLDQFIKQGEIENDRLTFKTDEVHGVWFEFKGIAQRGEGKTPNDEAYYVLKGTLVEHASDAKGNPAARSRSVLFKSFPEDVSAPARPTD
jgi:hypothetical protein